MIALRRFRAARAVCTALCALFLAVSATVVLQGCQAEEVATSPVNASGGGTGSGSSALISVSPTTGTTTEGGGTATFNVVLSVAPTANVTIPLTSTNTAEGTVSPGSLTFTSSNWNVQQTVTVTGVNDFVADGNVVYQVLTGAATSTDPKFNGADAANVTLLNQDNDSANIVVAGTAGLLTTEFGGTASYTMVLTSQPSAGVTIPLGSSNSAEGTVSPASLTFTSGNWSVPQTVTVTGANDLAVDGSVVYYVVAAPATSTDPLYGGRTAPVVTVTNLDNEVLLNSFDRGWWNNVGDHDSTNDNTYTDGLYHAYFQYDLAGVTNPIAQVRLRLYLESSSGALELMSLWDVSTPSVTLDTTATGQVAIYNDLGTGAQFGGFTFAPEDAGTFKEIVLNGAGLADVISKLGGTFAVGVALDTWGGTEFVRFSAGGEPNNFHQLILAR